jgi:hypothetical protein
MSLLPQTTNTLTHTLVGYQSVGSVTQHSTLSIKIFTIRIVLPIIWEHIAKYYDKCMELDPLACKMVFQLWYLHLAKSNSTCNWTESSGNSFNQDTLALEYCKFAHKSARHPGWK